MSLTEAEREAIIAVVELRTQKDIEEAFGKRFEALAQTIDKSYQSDRAAIRYAYNVVATAFGVALAILGFIGFRTWTDVEKKIRETVQQRIDSDVVLQAYVERFEELKVNLVVGRIEQELLSRNRRLTDSSDSDFKPLTADELNLLRTRLDGSQKGGPFDAEAATSILDVLRKAFEAEVFDNSDDSSEWRQIVATVDKATGVADQGVRRSAWAFLAACPFSTAREQIVSRLRELYERPSGPGSSARELRDNGPSYLLRMANDGRELSASMREDIAAAADAAIRIGTPEAQFPAALAKAILAEKRHAAAAQVIANAPMAVSALALITDPDILLADDPSEEDRKTLATALAACFWKWTAAVRALRPIDPLRRRANWRRLAANDEFYKSFSLEVLNRGGSEPAEVALAVRALFDMLPSRNLTRPSPRLLVGEADSRLRVVAVLGGNRLRLQDGSVIVPTAKTIWHVDIQKPDATGDEDGMASQ